MDYILGSITMFGFNWAPQGWAACNGATMQVNQNQALYSLLGNAFGGTAPTTFGLPDLRDRVPTGLGVIQPFAKAYGSATATLATNNIPAHVHTIQQGTGTTVSCTASATVNASDAQGDKLVPTGNYLGVGWTGSANTKNYEDAHNVTMASDAVQVSVAATFNPANLSAVGPAAAAQPFSVQPPSLVLNYAICTSGIYPQRP